MSNSNSIPLPTDHKFKNLAGQVFNRLTVIGYAGKQATKTMWLCLCECGKEIKVTGGNIKSGHAKSCGCLIVDRREARAVSEGRLYNPIPGTYRGTPEAEAFRAMWARSTNPKNPSYPIYKARVPDPVFKDFEEFMREIGPRPSLGWCSVDRVDNSLGYMPGNVRWANRETQNNNKSSNIRITSVATGTTVTLAQACRTSGLKYGTTYARIYAYGWSVDDATDGLYTEDDV